MSNSAVKWFLDQKGSGFIELEDGPDVIAHRAAVNPTGFKSPKKGGQATIDIVEGPKGPAANNNTAV